MEAIQELKITREELEKLSEDFLMRMLRIFAIQKDWIRMSVTAGFLPEFSRKKVFELILKGFFGLGEINSQAREGRDFFQSIRSTNQEKEFENIISEHINKRGGFCDDIVFEISQIIGRELIVSEIEDVVLACANGRRFDMALEAANSLPITKRAYVVAILN